jgi:hypothetical protein
MRRKRGHWKAWEGAGWAIALSESAAATIADQDLPIEKCGPDKPQFIYVETDSRPPVRSARHPRGTTNHCVLLSRDEARQLSNWLVEALDTLDADDASIDEMPLAAKPRRRRRRGRPSERRKKGSR